MIGVTINLFKPVTYKLAMRSFCIPAILTTYAAFFVEAFLLPGVLSPPYPSEGKIIEAINLLVVVGFVEYVMLKRIWDAPKKNYNKRIYHHLLLFSAYWGLFSLGIEAFPKLFQIPLRCILAIYFIYGVYITIGIHKNHLSLVSNK